MYTINNSGPRIDPWGIPQVSVTNAERSTLTVTYDLNQANV